MKLFAFILAAAVALGCSKENREMEPEEIEKIILENLHLGDPPERIQAFFEERGWPCLFDSFQKRYQCRYPTVDQSPEARSIGIYVYVDDNGKFLSSEVSAGYTWI